MTICYGAVFGLNVGFCWVFGLNAGVSHGLIFDFLDKKDLCIETFA